MTDSRRRRTVIKMTELFLQELDRESERCRRALEQVPDDRSEWKPHERSMIFGYLAHMVATMPSWVAMAITRDELELKPEGGPTVDRGQWKTSSQFLAALDKSMADARTALQRTDDDFLMTPWRLLLGGQVVFEAPRHVVIQDTFNHLSHHRGQMTVYLRLMGAKVPALYGPSADDQRF
ncbi:MAG: damage-inducible protein DinB [Acidobacteria bacterium]|nr:MAG: damage-inducible protein DinB [Acidobacteriota bacterium]